MGVSIAEERLTPVSLDASQSMVMAVEDGVAVGQGRTAQGLPSVSQPGAPDEPDEPDEPPAE